MNDDLRHSFGFDPDELHTFTGDFLTTLSQVQEEMAELTGRGQAADGQVTVAYSELKGVHDLKIGPRAMRLGADMLAQTIQEAIETARTNLRTQAADLVTNSLGTTADLEDTVTTLSTAAEDALARSLQNTINLTNRLR
ncbi:YbaB/EbfC family nucleoid-associated protein [Nonomuraea endophytica]|uniref:DNA-binding protein YbaB n=1 Tax=Nonomuraea endophytica TaxID=714136 RepID=A0A7W8ED33_9ACTN|nr:YbaB/EbfC family nucleoid-associated protein [Nonomuraea endophytica]MBB5074861.1 DNA-binding protein YbaB [Nonomuraea endophytica]